MLEKEGSHRDNGQEFTFRSIPLRLPRGCDPPRSWYPWSHSYYSRWFHYQGQGVLHNHASDQIQECNGHIFLSFCLFLCLKLFIDLDAQVLIGCDGANSVVAKYL